MEKISDFNLYLRFFSCNCLNFQIQKCSDFLAFIFVLTFQAQTFLISEVNIKISVFFNGNVILFLPIMGPVSRCVIKCLSVGVKSSKSSSECFTRRNSHPDPEEDLCHDGVVLLGRVHPVWT